MIAQIVFDLPLEGPFDYSVPEHLNTKVMVGSRVKVSLGFRATVGFVVGIIDQSDIAKLKPVLAVKDHQPVFNALDLQFARSFSAYYGCTLGEALETMLKNKDLSRLSIRREAKPSVVLHECPYYQYKEIIEGILNAHKEVLILVPDLSRKEHFESLLKSNSKIKVGMRSAVFEADGHWDAVIMIDEEDASFKQEQTPMYQTSQVLLMRSQIYGFDVIFVGVSPSVELMGKVALGRIQFSKHVDKRNPKVISVDLANYKFLPGLLSPPVRDAIQSSLNVQKKSLLILNRRGSYRVTRCTECAEVLKCQHCDSPLIYSRIAKEYLCRYCTFTAPGDIHCPQCHKPSWRSVGMGVEQLQTELKKYFPQARIASFESENGRELKDYDILIATQAVLRFQGQWQVSTVAFIDFDAELNRMDMRSSQKAWALVQHIQGMAQDKLLIQTRNPDHYVIKSALHQDSQYFYDEEFRLRKEFGFTPFSHWVQVSLRGKVEKIVQEIALNVYNEMKKEQNKDCKVIAPVADAILKKRDQYRYHVMVQSPDLLKVVANIKSAFLKIKRRRVIITLNVDP